MDCPNQKCNTKNLPDDARFCPNCGTAILCELHMCIPYPATIKKGDTSELYFSGIGIESIEVAGVGKYYGKIKTIHLSPKETQSYLVIFHFVNGAREHKIVTITVI